MTPSTAHEEEEEEETIQVSVPLHCSLHKSCPPSSSSSSSSFHMGLAYSSMIRPGGVLCQTK